MNSRSRQILLILVLAAAWGTVLSSPFRAFADMVRDVGLRLFDAVGASSVLSVFLAYLLLLAVLVLLSVLVRGPRQRIVAAACALSAFAYHLAFCIRDGKLYDVAFSTAVGLAIALAFLLFRSKKPVLWLTDAYIAALPALAIHDAFLVPVFDRIGVRLTHLEPWFILPTTSAVMRLDGFAGLPAFVWGLGVAILVVGSSVILSSGRGRG